MGNNESNLLHGGGGHHRHSRSNNSPTPALRKLSKHRSLSPKNSSTATTKDSPMREGSLKNRVIGGGGNNALLNVGDNTSLQLNELHQQVNRRISMRRAKSFRNANRPQNSFRLPVCSVTGMTVNQKKIILSMWHDMDPVTVSEFGRNIFDTCFRRDPRLLKVVDLQHLADSAQKWRSNHKFRIHVQRFCNILNGVIRSLDEPRFAADLLREFGATYAIPSGENVPVPVAVPSTYWDALLFSINNAAKDLQVESTSRGSESPSIVTATGTRFLLPPQATEEFLRQQQSTIGSTASSPPLLPWHPGEKALLSPTLSSASASASNSYLIGGSGSIEQQQQPFFRRGRGSVCPITAEAWNQLAIFSVGQMRFGYEMERVLQGELKRMHEFIMVTEELMAGAGTGGVGVGSGSNALSPVSDAPPRPKYSFVIPPDIDVVLGSGGGVGKIVEENTSSATTGVGVIKTERNGRSPQPIEKSPVFDENPKIYVAQTSQVLVNSCAAPQLIVGK